MSNRTCESVEVPQPDPAIKSHTEDNYDRKNERAD